MSHEHLKRTLDFALSEARLSTKIILEKLDRLVKISIPKMRTRLAHFEKKEDEKVDDRDKIFVRIVEMTEKKYTEKFGQCTLRSQ